MGTATKNGAKREIDVPFVSFVVLPTKGRRARYFSVLYSTFSSKSRGSQKRRSYSFEILIKSTIIFLVTIVKIAGNLVWKLRRRAKSLQYRPARSLTARSPKQQRVILEPYLEKNDF